ncbi:hypothetical protein [Zophobihabitans entericus]|uniref:Uncharacterized protein n=1 Tax=Zophobihabitans entericus TaxID=1635327 RepID=A0A6G9IC52_9GAMM|nr:hypothetical protein [Zophobihabitans entericus]QIQ21811.1 hypothetical protein IPMB12_09040 [Zophobihabitans entericus]
MDFILKNFDYRFFILDTVMLENTMKDNGKTRTKNILKYLTAHKNVYEQLCQNGYFFPIQEINSGAFQFFINKLPNSLPSEWQNIRTYHDQFDFIVTDTSSIWIIAGDQLYEWNHNYYKNHHEKIETINGKDYLAGKKISIEEGIYSLSISVLKRKNKTQEPNLGFLINFTKATNANSTINNLPTEFNFNGNRE